MITDQRDIPPVIIRFPIVRWIGVLIIACAAVILPACAGQNSASRQVDRAEAPVKLQCQLRHDPLAVNSLRPQLGWVLPWKGHGQFQNAYAILVASSRKLLAEK